MRPVKRWYVQEKVVMDDLCEPGYRGHRWMKSRLALFGDDERRANSYARRDGQREPDVSAGAMVESVSTSTISLHAAPAVLQ